MTHFTPAYQRQISISSINIKHQCQISVSNISVKHQCQVQQSEQLGNEGEVLQTCPEYRITNANAGCRTVALAPPLVEIVSHLRSG